jgi:quinolinate synthase
MADMAEISQVEACWEALERLGLTADTIPLTYMNSTAAIKAFCGERGGLVCTSSNARAAFEWAFARGKRILFLPDQHLGRNTGFDYGHSARRDGGLGPLGTCRAARPGPKLAASRILLWKGHCAVHQRFLPSHVDQVRAKYPGIQVIVHPECRWEVCQKADALGSTERLIKLVEEAPSGSIFADRHRDPSGQPHGTVALPRRASASSPSTIPAASAPPCIASARSTWPGPLENLVEGRVVNRIQVRASVKHWARVALDRMLETQLEQGVGNREQRTGNRASILAISFLSQGWETTTLNVAQPFPDPCSLLFVSIL